MSKSSARRTSTRKKLLLPAPGEWTFRTPAIAKAFDAHVREQLPWYDVATGIVAHLARCYVPEGGAIVDVGASTGNIGRALAGLVEARNVIFLPIDASADMRLVYDGPGRLAVHDAREFDFRQASPDLIVCFLSLMFVPVADRGALVRRMTDALRPGGALVVFDKMVPRDGYLGSTTFRLALSAKYENGAPPAEIIAKELSLSGLQRPMSEGELAGFVEVFRFGDFAGWVREA